MKKSQRVIAALIALLLVFNIGMMNTQAFAAEAAAAIGIGEVLKWLGIGVATTAVGWGTTRVLDSAFPADAPATTGNNYYSTYSPNGNGIGGMYSGAPSYYHAVDIDNNKITTYNTTTNNYVTNTVNRITYNQTNNTYYTNYNNTNYFITYRPTYVNVTYVVDGGGVDDAVSYNLYYQLPDGRNSHDLTANDVFGQVMLSDFVNYKQVIEDDGRTLQLLHFDGDTQNSAASGLTSSYGWGASMTYVDTGAFNKGVYWPSSGLTTFDIAANGIGSGDYTLEMRIRLGNLTYSRQSLMGMYLTTLTQQMFTSGGVLVDYNRDFSEYYPDEYLAILENFLVVKNADIEKTLYNDATFIRNFVGAQNPYNGSIFVNRVKIKQGSWPSLRQLENGDAYGYSYVKYNYEYLFENSQYSIEPLIRNTWMHLAFVRHNGVVTIYQNGLNVASFTDGASISLFDLVKWDNRIEVYLDELRLTKQALYTSNFTPSSMPFDTNKVLVLPETGVENRIAVKSTLAIDGTRIGGVRPTYPKKGSVYISLDDDNKVESIQQYNGSDWTNLDGSIYKNGQWKNLDEYDFSSFIIDEPDADETDATPLGNVNVTYVLKNVTVPDSVNYVVQGGSLAMSIIPDTGYTLPENIAVYMDNELLQRGIDYGYNGGSLSIPNVTGDIIISIVADETETSPQYGVSYLLTNLKLEAQTRTENSVSSTLAISEGYKLPEIITVSMGGNILQSGTAYSYNKTSGVVTVSNVTGDVLITATATIDPSLLPSPTPGPSPTPTPDDEEEDGLHSFWSFLEDLLNFVIDGIGSLLSVITNLLENLQGFGQGFVDFLTASLGFIPPEITTMLALGVGLMIVLAVIKMFKG